MQEGELQGWAERAAFGGLLAAASDSESWVQLDDAACAVLHTSLQVSTLLAWWRGTLGSGQAVNDHMSCLQLHFEFHLVNLPPSCAGVNRGQSSIIL